MDKFKKIIMILLILIFVVIALLALIKIIGIKEEYDSDKIIEFENQQNYKPTKKLQLVKIPNKYYAVKNIINNYIFNCNKYFNYDANDINKYVFTEEELEEYIKEVKQESAKILENIIASDYTEEISIEEIVHKYEADSIEINKMYISELSASVNMFLVYGYAGNEEEICFIVVTDSMSSSYKIYPETLVRELYGDLNIDNDIEFQCEEVKSNNYNKLVYTNISNETIVKEYFSNFKKMLESNSEKAYSLLDEQYRNKRFGSYENFEKFLDNNSKEIGNLNVKKYLVNNYESYTEYICKDQYDNVYIFNSTAYLEYSVKLDSYTIETEKFKEEYASSTDERKVNMNIDKWFAMINSRDYVAAYNVLDEEFRSKNFGSEENFEKYMREIFPSHYKVEYGTISKQSEDIYTKKITIEDISEDGIQYENTIIMQLCDGTDFIMSFFVRRH